MFPFLNLRRLIFPLGVSIAAVLPVSGADIIKLGNTIILSDGGSWTGGVVPGAGDVAVWDSTVTGPNSSQLGSDTSWAGIRITNVGGTQNTTSMSVTTANSSSANTLTLGTSGIDMLAATQALAIQAKITLAGNQTWGIPNVNTATNPAGLTLGEDLAFSAQVLGAAFNLGGFTVSKTSTGTLAISSGYTVSNGTINVDGGIVVIQGAGNRTTTFANTTTLNVNNTSTLRLNIASGTGGVSTQIDAPITLNTGSTLSITDANATNALNVTGNIIAAGNTTIAVSGASAGGINFTGNLSGSGNVSYNNTATSAVLVSSGDNSGYSGTVTIGGTSGSGTLRLTSATAGSSAAVWTVNTSKILQVDGVSVSLGTLNGGGLVINSHATNAATLSIGGGTFTGVISDGTAPIGITKVGASTLTLNGPNLYSGPTTVSSGALLVSSAQSGATAITVADGATFGVNVVTVGATLSAASLTIGNITGATLQFDAGALGNPTGAIANIPNLTAKGATTIKLLGTNLTPGVFTLLDYSGSIAGTGFGGLTLKLPFRVAGSLLNNTGNTSVDVSITGVDTPKWRGNVNGDWDIDANNNGATGTANWRTLTTNVATRYVEGAAGIDAVIFDDSATGTTTVNLTTTVSPQAVSVNNSALNYTFSGTGKISGATGLTKQGTGTLTIANSGANDYTGPTLVNAGTLRVGDGATNGLLGPSPVTVATDATLAFNRSDIVTVTTAITGAGTVAHTGTGTAIFAGTLGTSGPLLISAGTIQIGDNTATGRLGTGDVTIASAGTLGFFNSTGTISVPVSISGTGKILKQGVSEISLDGVDSFSGTIQIEAGTLAFQSTESDNGAPAVIVNGTGRLALGSGFANQTATISALSGTGRVDPQFSAPTGTKTLNVNQTINTVFSGTAYDATSGSRFLALTKSGTGTLTLSGANTYTGATTVDGGTLLVTGSLSGTAAIAINTGGTLGGTGTLNPLAIVSVNAGGTLGLGNDGIAGLFSAGPVTFAETSTFSLEIGATTSDQLAIAGEATLSGIVKVGLTLLADPTDGATFTIVDGSAPLIGYSSGARFSFLGNSLDQGEVFTLTNGGFTQSFQITYVADAGNDVALLAVPEPGAAAMVFGGVGLVLSMRRRRR